MLPEMGVKPKGLGVRVDHVLHLPTFRYRHPRALHRRLERRKAHPSVYVLLGSARSKYDA